jgi:hypothetical protein
MSLADRRVGPFGECSDTFARRYYEPTKLRCLAVVGPLVTPPLKIVAPFLTPILAIVTPLLTILTPILSPLLAILAAVLTTFHTGRLCLGI